ncbi:hypothetical protein [Paenibacillus sp. ATY16]|uniref:hypothetical protein n=1 Tax=Paenibacillus sp. ATY16 TaxID=1759312 RepID=UPI00200F432B|nr:hypothetical protein [Paenibacillus sp. ATY16]MCK9861368.1 hypothetical protein [Paenibacillus sp. ATY16]
MVEILIWIFAIGMTIVGYYKLFGLYKEYLKTKQEGGEYRIRRVISKILLPDNPVQATIILSGFLLLIALLIEFVRSIF